MEKLKIFFIVLCFYSTGITAQSTIERIGDIALYSSPLIVLGSSIKENDKEGIYMYAKGLTMNLAVTLALKEIINKERPNGEDFKSFPSGHTSITFQAAAFMQKRYGWKYGIPVYAVASFTGFSRVYAKKHYVEDVFAGAAFGILSSYIFTKKLEKDHISLTFDKKGNDVYFGYSYQF